MSKDLYDVINFNVLSHTFIYQCAPVLAGLKVSNLLIVKKSYAIQAQNMINECGLAAFVLYISEQKITFLVYNSEKLSAYINSSECAEFMKLNGHSDLSIKAVLYEISIRYRLHMRMLGNFPHELGIILGYPIEDVVGYIEHEGNDYLYNGYWKVYSNVEETKDRFKKFDEATEYMLRMMLNGEDLSTLVKKVKVA